KALDDLSTAIELEPGFVQAWERRGVAHLLLGQPNQAVTDFSTAIELEPRYSLACRGRGLAYGKLGRPNEAVADLSKATELAPTSAQKGQAYLCRAQAHGRLGHFEQARTDYQAALKQVPPLAAAHNGLAAGHVPGRETA